MRSHLFPTAVIAALAGAVAGALAAPTPHALPAVALGAVLVWRVELAAIVFAAAYAAVVIARLAWHGETLTRVGRDGIEVPRLARAPGEASTAGAESATDVADLEAMIGRLRSQLDTADSHSFAVEQPPRDDLA